MEEVVEAFNTFLSGEIDHIKQAEHFFIKQIKENPTFYEILFSIFNNSSNSNHKILSLILINNLIKINFPVIEPNFPHLAQLASSSIEYTDNKIIFKYQAEIIFRIATKINEIWDDFPNYLLLFRKTDTNLLPFCIFLYDYCLNNTEISFKYSNIFDELNQELLLCGLQYQDNEIQVLSTYHFTQSILKYTDEKILSQYQEHYNYVCQIAEKSIEMDNRNFLMFWHHIIDIKSEHSKPFYELARNFLQMEGIDPYWRIVLFQIIIKNYKFINQEDLESIINGYFTDQIAIEYIDYKGKIFTYLSHINPDQTYELFKSILIDLLSSDEDFKQYLGLVNLRRFVTSYIKHITGEISILIDLSLKIALKTIENFTYMAEFLTFFLSWNKLDHEDTEKVMNAVIETFVDQQNIEFQYQSLLICQKIGPDPIFFDKLIEVFDKIQPDSFYFYFSILLRMHSTENKMSNDKYDPFYKFIVDIFGQTSQKVNELSAALSEFSENEEEEEEADDDDEKEKMKGEIEGQLYEFLLLRGCSANLIWLLSFYNPQSLGELIDQVISSFIDLLVIDNDYDLKLIESNKFLSLKDVKNDFTFVFNKNKNVMIDKIRNYYDEIDNGQDLDDLCCILFDIDGFDSPGIESTLEKFDDLFHLLDHDIKFSLDGINNDMNEVVIPLSKLIYKIPQIELHQHFLTYIGSIFKYAMYSNELLNHITKILQRAVKPKRITFNQSNEWYLELCKEMNSFIYKTILPEINRDTYCLSFKTLSNLMMFFIYTNNDFGHNFLVENVLPFYQKYSESSEIDLLILFSKMIDNKYYNDEEINSMLELINIIIERGKIYFDSRPELLILITKVTKINSEFLSQYFQYAVQLFDEIKEDKNQLNTKIYCSYFLFSSFNKNPEEFKAIVPLIPEFLSVFPNDKIMNQFYEEIKTFFENSKDLQSKEFFEAIISSLSNYLSYQNNASLIFKFNEEFNNESFELFKKMTEFYCTEFNIENFEEMLEKILPEQQTSVQYILSLLQQ